ncbi:hypothetical protein R80B4_01327 [Fibrobacteres bacterium R8-0-B4]
MSIIVRHGRVLLLAVAVVGVFVYTAAAQTKGTFADSRDGQKYRSVKIGGKTWTAQNINYQTGASWCYGGDDSNCGKYGRLYDRAAAAAACPAGWRLPSKQEWDALAAAVGLYTAATALKSSSGWKEKGNGTDKYGFSALPGGYRDPDDGSFIDVGKWGQWWTATESEAGGAYSMSMASGSGYVYESAGSNNSYGFSVRCIAD